MGQLGRGIQIEGGLPAALDGLQHAVDGHRGDVVGGRVAHLALAVAAAHGNELPGLHELVEDVVHDTRREVDPAADLLGGHRASAVAEVAHDEEHHREQDLAPLVVAHEQRLAFLVEALDILVGERELAAEEEDLPRGLHPDEEQGQGGEAAVDGVVGGHPALQVDIAPLEEQEDRPGDDARHQGAARAHPGIGDDHVEQGEHGPYDHHRGEPREQGEVPAAVESQQPFGVVGRRRSDDPQQRDDQHHGDVVGPLAGDAALDLDLPDVVEGALDRPEDADHGPEQHDERHGGHHAALRASEGVFGEVDQVAHHLGILREEPVEARGEAVGQPEALDHGEDHGGDGHERHERVEGQRGAAHQRAVLLEAAGRIEEQLVLLHEPPHQRAAPGVGREPENRVGEIGRDVAQLHGRAIDTKIAILGGSPKNRSPFS